MNKPERITFAQALEDYILSKDKLLSPATVRGYRSMQRNSFERINSCYIEDITEKTVQQWVNTLAHYSAKTIRNRVGLFTVVMHQNGINLNMKSVTLKPKIKPDYIIPSEDDMVRIARAIRKSKIEIPVIIALTLGLRQSEIASLKWANYDGVYLKIDGAIVPDEHNKLVEKRENKSYESKRILEVPDYLKELLDKSYRFNERISPHTPQYILKQLHKICRENGIMPYTMHSLRHANASTMLKLNVPDKYAMERMGHSTPTMLKQVYQHLYREEQAAIAKRINDYFNTILR